MQHFTKQGAAYDEERTQMLKRYHLQVLRFTNSQIDSHFDDVCLEIDTVTQKRSKYFMANPYGEGPEE